MQESSLPYQMDWMIEGPSSASKWQPFFAGKFVKPDSLKENIQMPRLTYQDTPLQYAKDVESGLRRELQKDLEKFFAEHHRALQQNRTVSSKLRMVLKRLERNKMPQYSKVIEDHTPPDQETPFSGDEDVPNPSKPFVIYFLVMMSIISLPILSVRTIIIIICVYLISLNNSDHMLFLKQWIESYTTHGITLNLPYAGVQDFLVCFLPRFLLNYLSYFVMFTLLLSQNCILTDYII